MSVNRKTVVLRGGAPWGFRLSSSSRTPVYIDKVRSQSKAALGGLTTGDTLVSVNGVPSVQQSLREINDVIGSVRDQLVIEVQSSTQPRSNRFDSTSSLDTKENSPVYSLQRITPQSPAMDYHQYNNSSRITPAYPSYTSTTGYSQYDNHRDPRYTDSYGRSIQNPLPAMFRTATMASNSPQTPSASTRGQQYSYHLPTSNSMYDTPRNYNGAMSSGYVSDTNDVRRSSISMRPTNSSNSNVRRTNNNNNNNPNPQQSYYSKPATTYNTRIIQNNDQSYFSDSEYASSGPRYTKISRQANPVRRPSNVVLPIRSITSKAYDEYVPPQQPKQQPIDVYRYQQEQREREQREREQRERDQRDRERERQEQIQRQLYEQQQAAAAAAAARYNLSQDHRRKSDPTIDHELGADLLKSPIANKKVYADSSFFKTSFNTYPTIEEQKKMAHKIASILQGGDPTSKGASKFERQRQRAEKYTLEAEANATPTLSTSNYRPLRPVQTNDIPFTHHPPPPPPPFDTSNVPDCIKHSLDQAQYVNPLRYVGAPDNFKQIHMQEHVTHTNVSPQAAMSLVADLNANRGKGAALFQKRKARSEKWVVDENNVKKQGFQPTSTHISPTSQPWGQVAPDSWSGDEGPYTGPNFSPVRPKFNPPAPPSAAPSVPEPILSPPPTQNAPRFGDFNAKPKGFGSWNTENVAPKSPRGSIDSRKPLNLAMEPSIREGIAESHMRNASQPFSPPYDSQPLFSPNQQQQQNNDFFNFPSSNVLGKWKNQEYSPWNQSSAQDSQRSQMPMTREGIDQLRQRLTQQNPPPPQPVNQPYSAYNQRSGNSASYNPYPSTQGPPQQQHFTDL
ncbi:unnamed protein product [Adineta steineri]|uniref:PDZ domain-containing protein n=1 Tax=Adineta steineri TaxID=433720 RepID=A0A818R3R1_9BILA|nr:unnamed protein product [Adineta steineri]CAF3643795.1 unnamed protein product [Adineta steineri]